MNGSRGERTRRGKVVSLRDTRPGRQRAPCPFCGWIYADTRYYVSRTHPTYRKFWLRCCSCDCSGPLGDSREDALERWNMRRGRDLEPIRVPVPLDFPR